MKHKTILRIVLLLAAASGAVFLIYRHEKGISDSSSAVSPTGKSPSPTESQKGNRAARASKFTAEELARRYAKLRAVFPPDFSDYWVKALAKDPTIDPDDPEALEKFIRRTQADRNRPAFAVPEVELRKYLASNPSSQSYIFAYAASGNVAFLDEGLAAFGDDPSLKWLALMHNDRYKSDPALLEQLAAIPGAANLAALLAAKTAYGASRDIDALAKALGEISRTNTPFQDPHLSLDSGTCDFLTRSRNLSAAEAAQVPVNTTSGSVVDTILSLCHPILKEAASQAKAGNGARAAELASIVIGSLQQIPSTARLDELTRAAESEMEVLPMLNNAAGLPYLGKPYAEYRAETSSEVKSLHALSKLRAELLAHPDPGVLAAYYANVQVVGEKQALENVRQSQLTGK